MMSSEFFFSKKLLKLEIAEWLLILIITLYSAVFSYYLIMKFYSFRTGAWDLGILVQSIASASRGNLFKYNVELYYCPAGSYFGVHFSPILFTLVPFFSILPKVETILVLHTVILALGSVPIYLIAKNCFKTRLQALTLSITYLLNPSLQGINWYDITPQTFFPVLILSATYFLKRRKPIQFLFFLTLSLMTLEQASYFIMVYALYVLWDLKEEFKKLQGLKRKFFLLLPLITLMFAVFWMFLSSNVKYTINPSPPEELLATGNFRFLGVDNIAEIPFKVLTDLPSFLRALHYDLTSKIFYLLITMAPSCFLCIASPVALLPALLWLFLAIVSNWPPYYYLGFHYPAFTLPFVMIATIDTAKNFGSHLNSQLISKALNKIFLLLLCVNLTLSIFASPLSPIQESGDFTNFRDYGVTYPSSIDAAIMKTLSKLPADAMILTTSIPFVHLSTNPKAYVIPSLNIPSERLYITTINYLSELQFDYIVVAYYYWDKGDADTLYNKFIRENGDYRLYIYAPGLEIYKRNYDGNPELLSARFSYKELSRWGGLIISDSTAESGKVIKFTRSPKWGYYAWFGPYVYLLPGNYTAKFKIKVDSLQIEGRVLKLDVWSNTLQKTIASYDVYSKDFSNTLTWHTFTLSFNLPVRVTDIELRGLEVAEGVTVWLDYVDVFPTSIK